MTNQHPLTDEIIQDIDLRHRSASFWECHGFEDVSVYERENMVRCMRAVADWQLEQVFKWIRDNIQSQEADYEWYYVFDSQIEDLKKAMRPTTQEE